MKVLFVLDVKGESSSIQRIQLMQLTHRSIRKIYEALRRHEVVFTISFGPLDIQLPSAQFGNFESLRASSSNAASPKQLPQRCDLRDADSNITQSCTVLWSKTTNGFLTLTSPRHLVDECIWLLP